MQYSAATVADVFAMPEKVKHASWRGELKSLAMIGASLAVICAIVFQLLAYQQAQQRQQLRVAAFGLVRMLAEVPLDQLLPSQSTRGPLDRLSEVAGDQLAYISVEDANGQARFVHDVGAGVSIPPAAPRANTSEWLAERELQPTSGELSLLEFQAPLMRGPDLAGFVRLGYFAQPSGLAMEQMSLFASLALPVFLLVPLFHFFLRREIRPLRNAGENLTQMLDSGQLNQVKIEASGELGEFMHRFNSLMAGARDRLQALEHEQTTLRTSSKLLRFGKSRIERALEAIPETVFVLDEGGNVSFVNGKVTALLGVSSAEVLNKPAAQWCQDPELLAFLSRCNSSQRAGTLSDGVEFSSLAAPEKTLSVCAYPLFSTASPNESIGMLAIVRDITLEVLARKNRGDFVAHVAHELKTPLNVLSMYSDALRSESADDPAFRLEAVNVIHDEVDRLGSLINNLLNITRIENGSLELSLRRTRLDELLQDAFDTVARAEAAAELEMVLEIPKNLTPLSLDKDLLRVAVNNLLTNAIKYNRKGGRVTLRVEELEQFVRIDVIDTGIGIEANDLERIFDKFYRSEDGEVRERSGHGLGLSLARDIVALHSGQLDVSSEKSTGTTFSIELWKDADAMRRAS